MGCTSHKIAVDQVMIMRIGVGRNPCPGRPAGGSPADAGDAPPRKQREPVTAEKPVAGQAARFTHHGYTP